MNFALTRKLIIFGLVLPLAAIVGFTLATPQDSKTFFLMTAVTGLLLLPVMLKWYHPLLIFCWNASINIFFLPGKPQLWMLLSVIGLGIAVLNHAMDREKSFINVPALTLPLLFFITVVFVTGQLTGGVGIRSLGGQTIGGKGYFSILFAVMGYFALTSRPIPIERASRYMSIFFLAGASALVSNLAYMLGPAFYFLYYFFPVDFAMGQAIADYAFATVRRFHGLALAGAAAYYFMMVRFGIRGIFDLTQPWRLVFFMLAILVSLFGGYRSLLITFAIHFSIQFYFERLVRTRLCVFLLLGGLAAGALALPFINKLPLAVQRCVAFIPGVPVNQTVKHDTYASTAWRVEMWGIMVPQIPKYLILGKGYALNPSDLYLANQAVLRGLAKSYEVSLVGGAYHSGPLSLIITFGIFGTLGFLWLLGAGIWVLYRNYRYGDPALSTVNTFLLAYFIMRVAVFLFVFGAIDSEMYLFVGVLGLSVSLNRGVRKAALEPDLAPASLAPQPA